MTAFVRTRATQGFVSQILWRRRSGLEMLPVKLLCLRGVNNRSDDGSNQDCLKLNPPSLFPCLIDKRSVVDQYVECAMSSLKKV